MLENKVVHDATIHVNLNAEEDKLDFAFTSNKQHDSASD
jgi:hypothetical protein